MAKGWWYVRLVGANRFALTTLFIDEYERSRPSQSIPEIIQRDEIILEKEPQDASSIMIVIASWPAAKHRQALIKTPN